MHLATIAAVTLAVLSTACTIQIVEAPDDGDESTSTTVAASSFPEQAESSSSTGELEDSSSTGREIGSSSGEAEVDDETSTGDDTTGEVEGSTSEIGETSSESTDASTGVEDTGDLSTTGDETTGSIPLVPMGEPCTLDSDCGSGFCIGDGLNDTPRCSAPCDPDTATDCLDLGSPGLCTWGGGDAHWCTGAFDFNQQDLRLATPDPDVEFLFYQNGGFLPTAADRHAYLVPPQQAAFYIEVASVDEPGYGDVVVDLFASDGSLIGTAGEGQGPTIEPKGIHHYHWLIVRPAEDKKVSYQLWLKELCWPNC